MIGKSVTEIAIKNKENAYTIAKILLSEGYVVMLSEEEDLTIIDMVFSSDEVADRNDVTFMSNDELEEKYYLKSDIDEENK